MIDKIKKFNSEYMKPLNVNFRMMDISSEVGELAKEVIKSQNYGQGDFKKTKDLETEFGDVLYSLISFGIENNIDIEKAVWNVLQKYKERFEKKGHIGSDIEIVNKKED